MHSSDDTQFPTGMHTDESYGGLSVELQAIIAVSVVVLLVIIVSVVVAVCIKKRRVYIR